MHGWEPFRVDRFCTCPAWMVSKSDLSCWSWPAEASWVPGLLRTQSSCAQEHQCPGLTSHWSHRLDSHRLEARIPIQSVCGAILPLRLWKLKLLLPLPASDSKFMFQTRLLCNWNLFSALFNLCSLTYFKNMIAMAWNSSQVNMSLKVSETSDICLII